MQVNSVSGLFSKARADNYGDTVLYSPSLLVYMLTGALHHIEVLVVGLVVHWLHRDRRLVKLRCRRGGAKLNPVKSRMAGQLSRFKAGL